MMNQSDKILSIAGDTKKYYSMRDLAEFIDVTPERMRVIICRLMDEETNQVDTIKKGRNVFYRLHKKPRRKKQEMLWRLAIFGECIE